MMRTHCEEFCFDMTRAQKQNLHIISYHKMMAACCHTNTVQKPSQTSLTEVLDVGLLMSVAFTGVSGTEGNLGLSHPVKPQLKHWNPTSPAEYGNMMVWQYV